MKFVHSYLARSILAQGLIVVKKLPIGEDVTSSGVEIIEDALTGSHP